MFIMFKYLCICVVDVVKCIFLTEGCKHIKKINENGKNKREKKG